MPTWPADFLRFASSFDLSNTVLLTTFELGDIFLSSLKFIEPSLRGLSYTEFLQALVRCALVAYSKISESTILDKLRGLFLYMWRSINKNVPKAWGDGRRTGSTYAGDLLAGAATFNRKFIAQWAADGNRDYLSPPPALQETGMTSLGRIFESDQSARALSGSARASAPLYDQQLQQPFTYSSSPTSAAAGSSASGGGGGWPQQQQQYQQQQQQQQYQASGGAWPQQQQQYQDQQQWIGGGGAGSGGYPAP